MPLACTVYELVGKGLEGVVEVLRKEGILEARGSVGASGVAELPGDSKVPFEVYSFRGKLFLIVLAGRRRAARVARRIAELAGVEVQEVRVRPEKFLYLFEGSVVRLVVFDMVRVPGLRRIVLTGDAVSDTELYREFFESCEVKYVLFQTGEGLALGVSSSGTLVALSRLTSEELLTLVKENLVPLISPLL